MIGGYCSFSNHADNARSLHASFGGWLCYVADGSLFFVLLLLRIEFETNQCKAINNVSLSFEIMVPCNLKKLRPFIQNEWVLN